MAKRTTQKSADLFARAAELARNMWWTWDHATQQFFAALDPVLWEAIKHAPLELLERLSSDRKAAILANESFEKSLSKCELAFKKYMAAKTWFPRSTKGRAKRVRIAYFCAEFGLHESFPQYSGGLGVLAGDHLKSASDLGVPLCAVGLLYRNGYYQQQLDASGAHVPLYPEYDFSRFPVIDTKLKVRVPLGNRTVVAKIWRLDVGRVPAYLLDTDIPENRAADRKITQRLYGGDNETRIQQEIILGVGGVLALEKVGEKVTVFHLNEGHAAFCALQRLSVLLKGRMGQRAAMNKVRRSTVFTTHTPVPAGHDRFDPKLTMKYVGHYADKLGLTRDEFLALGRENPLDKKELFCMTVLALNLAEHRNGVAKLHGEVTREMWQHVHDVETADEVPIGHVTNGIHSQTWLAPEMDALYRKYLKPKWVGANPQDDWWRSARMIPAAALWETRNLLRRKLVHFIRQRLIEQIQRKLGPAEELAAAHAMFDPEALTIGFARRFATYKRAPLIFKDAARVSKIMNAKGKPVQLVFAGKAHPADKDGQRFAQQIYKFARTNGLTGRVVLIENYDFTIGRMMTSGCDVWLNNPLRPREASGTSGMKPPLHGGLNFSILDGWWPEGYNGRNGWSIGDGSEMKSQSAQDKHDANRIYELLEKEIVPLFYNNRGRDGVPRLWVKMMQNSMASVCGMFNSNRMVGEYVENYYLPAHG